MFFYYFIIFLFFILLKFYFIFTLKLCVFAYIFVNISSKIAQLPFMVIRGLRIGSAKALDQFTFFITYFTYISIIISKVIILSYTKFFALSFYIYFILKFILVMYLESLKPLLNFY